MKRPGEPPPPRMDLPALACCILAGGILLVAFAFWRTAEAPLPSASPVSSGGLSEPTTAPATFPPVIAQAAAAMATFYAPKPTATPPPTPRATTQALPYCGPTVPAGMLCEWPPAPPPTPTPVPACGTPAPGDLCRWRFGQQEARPR